MTVDPKGRLIVSDQENQGLCRITPAPLDGSRPTQVERLDVPVSAAQGMLFAFDSLYLSINGGPEADYIDCAIPMEMTIR